MRENKLTEISIIFIGFTLLVVILNQFQAFLRPFVISIILTFLLVPITRLSKEKKILMGLNTISIIIIIFISISVITTILTNDGTKINKTLSDENKIDNSLSTRFQEININLFGINIDLSKFFSSDKISQIISKIMGFVGNSLGTFFSEFFLVILFLIFLLPSHDTTIKKISKKMNTETKKKFQKALDEIEKSIRAYLSIKSIISLGTAITSLIIMMIFSLKYAMLFALLVFALNFIPNIGSFIAVFIIIFSHFINVGIGFELFLLTILLIIVQIIFGNILEPKIAGKQLELSPVIIILSLFFWGSVWGIGGMFFAVPLTSIIKIVLENIEVTKGIVKYLN